MSFQLLPLTVYKQIISGTNYKVRFPNKKDDFPIIQEYEYYRPLAVNTNGIDVYNLTDHKEYGAVKGLMDFNDASFSKIEYELYKKLKNGQIQLNYISNDYVIENDDTKFFFINADTDKGENNYILCQDKANEEFYVYNQI